MSDNKPANFVQWMNINFSKPYLIFILWWIIINIDFVLILMGKTHIWNEINYKYNMLKTVLDINPKDNAWNAWLYFFLYNLIFPLLFTFITIVGISWIMNSFKILSNLVEDKCKHWEESNTQKRKLKQENKIKDLEIQYKSMGKEFQEKINSLNQCNFFLYKEDFYRHIQKIDLNNSKKYEQYEYLNFDAISKLDSLDRDYFGFNNTPENVENINRYIFNVLREYKKLLIKENKKHNSEVEKLHNIRNLFNKNEKIIIESFLMNLRWRDRFYLMKTIFKKKSKNKEIST